MEQRAPSSPHFSEELDWPLTPRAGRAAVTPAARRASWRPPSASRPTPRAWPEAVRARVTGRAVKERPRARAAPRSRSSLRCSLRGEPAAGAHARTPRRRHRARIRSARLTPRRPVGCRLWRQRACRAPPPLLRNEVSREDLAPAPALLLRRATARTQSQARGASDRARGPMERLRLRSRP